MLTLNEADKLLMIPGPTPVQREILIALGEPTISHMGDAMAEIVSLCLEKLKPVAGTESALPFVFAGSGTLAQEIAVANLVARGERLLVVSNGFFGDRFASIAESHGIDVDLLSTPWGESVVPQELDRRLGSGSYQAVTITQVETSTGVMAPLPGLCAVARKHNVPIVVDAVCALGGIPVNMDGNGIDILLSGAQKALGVPPGLTILFASEMALERRQSLARPPGYYLDLLNWEASMHDPHVYFSTHPVNYFYALLAGLEIIEREGLEERFDRHVRIARGFRAGLSEMGFTSLTAPPFLAPTLSVFAYPDGVEDVAFRSELSKEGVVVAAALGDFKGRGARFGHMGNITETEVLQALAAIERTLARLGSATRPGAGVEAALAANPEPVAAS